MLIGLVYFVNVYCILNFDYVVGCKDFILLVNMFLVVKKVRYFLIYMNYYLFLWVIFEGSR